MGGIDPLQSGKVNSSDSRAALREGWRGRIFAVLASPVYLLWLLECPTDAGVPSSTLKTAQIREDRLCAHMLS